MLLSLWVISILLAVGIASHRKLDIISYVIVGILLGPIAVILALLDSSKQNPPRAALSNAGQGGLEDAQKRLVQLQQGMVILNQRMKELENRMQTLSQADRLPEAAPSSGDRPVPDERPAPVPPPKMAPPQTAFGLEMNFGRNWLSKIGMGVLGLGVAFLIQYSFKYLGPHLKIALGYLAGGSLFVLGAKLEKKNNLIRFGQVLLGGAWALFYFTTYAMHHFEASRILTSQFVDLCLLTAVAIGMMLHVLKYRSQEMMAVALTIAYLTSTVGKITAFTFGSTMILGAWVLFLVYKLKWGRILNWGVFLTYLVHGLWVAPNLTRVHGGTLVSGMPPSDYLLMLNALFLAFYWVLYWIGTHGAALTGGPALEKNAAAANFINAALFGYLIYPLLDRVLFEVRFEVVAGIGLFYLLAAWRARSRGCRFLFIGDVLCGVFALTAALMLKFLPASVVLLWMIEVPLLIGAGILLKEGIFRYLGYGLALVAGFWVLSDYAAGGSQPVPSFPMFFTSWLGLWSFVGMISSALCFGMLRRWLASVSQPQSEDQAADLSFSALACFYLTAWLSTRVHDPWYSVSLFASGILLWMLGRFLGLLRFRIFAYGMLLWGGLRFILFPIGDADSVRWLGIGFNSLTGFWLYEHLRFLKKKDPKNLLGPAEPAGLLGASSLLLMVSIHQYVLDQGISLSLGGAGVILVLLGIGRREPAERWGGLALLVLTLGRVVLVDLSQVDMIFRILTFILLGLLLLAVSFFYHKLSPENNAGTS